MPVIDHIVRFFQATGVHRLAYKCDRESYINAMLETAMLESARVGIKVHDDSGPDPEDYHIAVAEDADEFEIPCDAVKNADASSLPNRELLSPLEDVVATPELTHPGESQTNGLAERAVQSIEGFASTLLAALQARIRMPIPSDHPLLGWHHLCH